MKVEVYTLDVGHGLCQAILFPGGDAVIIDGGPFSSLEVVQEFLSDNVRRIIAYVLTHNHEDHYGAALNFLETYPTKEKLNYIVLLVDRTSSEDIPFLQYADERMKKKTILDRVYAAISDAPFGPKELPLPPADGVSLKILYPDIWETIDAMRPPHKRRKTGPRLQNQVGCCLMLEVKGKRCMFTGDMDRHGFTLIAQQYGFPITADVLTLPHHGGTIPGQAGSMTWPEIIEMISPSFAIVSCGSQDQLQRSSFEPLVQNGAKICCTEITKECHPNFRNLAPALTTGDPALPGLSERNGEAVSCFGSILTLLEDGHVEVVGYDQQRQRISEAVVSPGTPLCSVSS